MTLPALTARLRKKGNFQLRNWMGDQLLNVNLVTIVNIVSTILKLTIFYIFIILVQFIVDAVLDLSKDWPGFCLSHEILAQL